VNIVFRKMSNEMVIMMMSALY